MAINMGSAIAYLELDTSKFTSGFRSAANDLKVFGDKTATTTQKAKGVQSALKSAGSTLTKSLTTPLLGVGAASVKVTSDFESAMSQVAATMGKSKSEIKDLENFALKMGSTTAFSATEAAEGLNVLAMSGLDANEQMSALPSVLNLASAGAMSLESSASYVTGTVKGFSDTMDNAAYYTDLMAKGATLANTDVSALGEAMSSGAATASSYGQTADSMTLSLLKLAEQNVTGSEAATALNRAMADLYTPTTSAKKALDDLGVSAYDSSGEARDFNDVVDDLNGALSGMSTEQQNALKNTIFTTYGLQAFNKMTTSSTDTVQKFKDGLADASGSAADQAKEQLDNLKGAVTLLKSALEGAGISIGSRLTPYLKKLADFITDLVTKFNNLSDSQKDTIVKFGLIAAAVGPVMLILSKLIGAVLSIKSGFSKLSGIGKVFEGITGPVGLVIAVIAILVAAFVTLIKTNEKFRKVISRILDDIKKKFEDFTQGIVDRINELGFNFEDITDALSAAWKGFCDILVPLFTNAFEMISDVIGGVLDVILGVVDVFIGIFTGDFGQIVTGLKEQFGGIVDIVTGIFGNLIGAVGGVASKILEKLGLQEASDKIRDFFNGIKDFILSFPETIAGAIDAIITFFTQTIPNAIESLGISIEIFFTITIPQMFANLGNAISNFVNSIISFFTVTIPQALSNFANVTIPNAINAVINWFVYLPERIASALETLLGTIVKFGLNAYNWAVTTIPKVISSIVTFFQQLPGKIGIFLSNTIQKIVQFGTSVAQKATEAGKNFLSNLVNNVKNLPGKINTLLKNTISKVTSFASNFVSKAKSSGKSFLNGVISGVKSLPNKINTTLKNIISYVKQWASNMASKGKEAANKFATSITNGVASLPGKTKTCGKNIVSGIINGVSSMGSALANKAKSVAESFLKSFKKALGIKSPSRVFQNEIGVNVVKGIIKGVDKQKKNAKKSAKELSALYVSAAETKLNTLKRYNDISVSSEIEYWELIRAACKKGTSAYNEATIKIKELKKNLNDQMKKLNEDYASSVKSTTDKIISNVKDVMSSYDSAVESRAEQISNEMSLFEKFKSTTSKTAKSLTKNLKTQVDGLKEWDEALNSLEKRNVPSDLLSKIIDEGVDSLADVKLLVSMTDEELTEYVSLWQEKQKLATERAVKEIDKSDYIDQIKDLINEAGTTFDDLEEAYVSSMAELGVTVQDSSVKIGNNVISGLKSGISSKFPEFLEYVKTEISKITTTANQTLGIKSPSRVFKKIGQYTAEGLSIGFVEKMDEVIDDIEESIDEATDVNPVIDVGIGYKNVLKEYSDIFTDIKNSIAETLTTFVDSLEVVMDEMINQLDNLIDRMSVTGDAVVSLKKSVGTFGTEEKESRIKERQESDGNNNNNGGDTYVFYNTQDSPYEYARQIKKVKKELMRV
jgi:TP901 family phage tail tape measure protein